MLELDHLPGLTTAKKAVAEFASLDSGVHAVLLYGARGAGKRDLANFLARQWLSGGDTDHAASKSFDSGRNADLLVVEPMGPSRIIRDIQITSPKRSAPNDFKGVPVLDFLRTPPLNSLRKVVLIEDADRMNADSANVLLKSLEEPYPYAKFILTTTSVGSILPTILSRCVAVSCELPNTPNDDPLWRLAEGAPGRYAQFQQNEAVFRGVWQFAETLPKRSLDEALVASETLKGISESLQKAIESNARTANTEALELLVIACRHLHPEWYAARSAMIEGHRRVVGNGNPTLVFDALMTNILAG